MMHYWNKNLKDIFFWPRAPKGEVGIEIEVEGGPWPLAQNLPKNWVPHEDHSLRNGGMEFVIRQPINREKTLESLKDMKKAFNDAGSTLTFSYRTSIHVHVNVQDLTIREWCTFITLFTTIEEVLVDIVGPKRAGNKFCLRMKDADEPLQIIKQGLKREDLHSRLRDDLKYAAMNVLATQTHGTLEFRAMEGNFNMEWINHWVQLLCHLKDVAKKLNDPREVANQMSALGPLGWLQSIMPPENPIALKAFAAQDLGGKLYEGVRIAQDLCFAIGWESEETPAVTPKKVSDPLRDFNDFDDVAPAPQDRAFIHNPFGEVRLADMPIAAPAAPPRFRQRVPRPAAPGIPQPRW